MALRKFLSCDGTGLRIGDDGGLTEADVTFTVKERDGVTMLVGDPASAFGLYPIGTVLSDARMPEVCLKTQEMARRRVLGALQVSAADRSRADGRALRTWIQVMRPGVVDQFEASPSLFDRLVQTFGGAGEVLPVFKDVARDEMDGVVGWICGLDARGETGLFALVEWQDSFLPWLMPNTRYPHASAAVLIGARDSTTGAKLPPRLVNVLLTSLGTELAGRL